MAEYLTTKGIISSLEDIIKFAKKEVVIVSPFLKIPKTMRERIISATHRGVSVTIVYGKNRFIEPETISDLRNKVTLLFYEKLHGKCYYNESKMLITSMNLYEVSEKNREFGILLDKEYESNIYEKSRMECQEIISFATIQEFEDLSYQEQLISKELEHFFSYSTEVWNVVSKTIKAKSKNEVKNILSENGLSRLVSAVLERFERCEDYLFFEILDVLPTNDIVVKRLDNGEHKKYHASSSLKLPPKGSYVAAKTNDTFFNKYYILGKNGKSFSPIPGGNSYVALTSLSEEENNDAENTLPF